MKFGEIERARQGEKTSSWDAYGISWQGQTAVKSPFCEVILGVAATSDITSHVQDQGYAKVWRTGTSSRNYENEISEEALPGSPLRVPAARVLLAPVVHVAPGFLERHSAIARSSVTYSFITVIVWKDLISAPYYHFGP